MLAQQVVPLKRSGHENAHAHGDEDEHGDEQEQEHEQEDSMLPSPKG